MTTSLAYVLREARKAAGLTQQALADALGISRAAVGQWEAGTHEPSTENLIKVCGRLGIEVDGAVRGNVVTLSNGPHHAGPSSSVAADLTAKGSFKLLGSLGSQYYKDKYPNVADFVPVHVCHTYAEEAYSRVSQEPFSNYPRPLALKNTPDVYGVLLDDDRLAPRYRLNEIVYVNSKGPFSVNDYVIIHSGDFVLLERPGGGDGINTEKCYFGRFLGLDVFGLKLEQHMPERILTIPASPIMVVHRIFPYAELIPFTR